MNPMIYIWSHSVYGHAAIKRYTVCCGRYYIIIMGNDIDFSLPNVKCHLFHLKKLKR